MDEKEGGGGRNFLPKIYASWRQIIITRPLSSEKFYRCGHFVDVEFIGESWVLMAALRRKHDTKPPLWCILST